MLVCLLRLIAELEQSDRRLAEVRLTYEKKLTELSAQIKKMEAERDKVLMEAEAKKTDKASQEQAKVLKVRRVIFGSHLAVSCRGFETSMNESCQI